MRSLDVWTIQVGKIERFKNRDCCTSLTSNSFQKLMRWLK